MKKCKFLLCTFLSVALLLGTTSAAFVQPSAARKDMEPFLDVSSVGELGRYIVNFGIMEFPEDALPYLDYERIGTEYDANHGGVFRGTSYITKMADAPAQDLDDGRTQQITLHLYTSKVGDTMPGPYRLTLPACEA